MRRRSVVGRPACVCCVFVRRNLVVESQAHAGDSKEQIRVDGQVFGPIACTRDRSLFLSSYSATFSYDHDSAPRPFQLKHRPQSGSNCLQRLDMHVDQVCELCAASCSFIACTWLLVHISRVPRQRPKSAVTLTDPISDVGGFDLRDLERTSYTCGRAASPHRNTPECVCRNQILLVNFSRHVSLWIEMHLAASVVLRFFRVLALKPMRCALYLIWVPGLILSLCSAFTEPWTYDHKERVCARRRLFEELRILLMSLTSPCASASAQAPISRSSVEVGYSSRRTLYRAAPLGGQRPMLSMHFSPTDQCLRATWTGTSLAI